MKAPLSLGFSCLFLIACVGRAADAKPESGEAKERPLLHARSIEEEPPLSVTEHTITIGGRVLKYHATAGYIVLKEEEGKPLVDRDEEELSGLDGEAKPTEPPERDKDGLKATAKIFFVAYTLDDVPDPAKRPVSFAFNGGPGSASIWLHLGALGPKRAPMTDEGEAPPPPYSVVDNESSWLDLTDLVFIDPVSTGFSRTEPKESPAVYHSNRGDIASVADFIRLYLTRNSRWASPKFLVGESYGTYRAAGLSDYLQSRFGIYVNGITLISTALNYEAFDFSPQNLLPYVSFLPTYATAAWYHKKLAPDLEAEDVTAIADQARKFAGGDFAHAIAEGDRLPEADARKIAAQVSRFIGLPESYILQRRLRVTAFEFFTHLLMDEGKIIGRYDARITGLRYEPGRDADRPWYDPSDEAVHAPFNGAFNDYIRRDLGFKTDIPYESLTGVRPWNFSPQASFPNAAEDLRLAMTRNPYLKVMVVCGYYDLATPFYSAEGVVASLNLDPAVRKNLSLAYYESGHMVYLRKTQRAKLKADFANLMNEALSEEPVHSAAR